MLDLLLNNVSSSGFLAWWNDNPITFGGDKYSPCPGLTVHYLQYSDSKTFEIKIEPVQADRPAFTQSLLTQILREDTNQHIRIAVTHGSQLVGEIVLEVDADRQWATGVGEWILLDEFPTGWELEWSVF